ncbi:MAG: thermonuclease family protein [Deltaproteobacteria bacterium]|nr:thermonuclease family protein [Deltaproteobacteria bacterium]
MMKFGKNPWDLRHLNGVDFHKCWMNRQPDIASSRTIKFLNPKPKLRVFPDKALSFNQKLVLSQKIGLEFDKDRHDRYGRLLAYIIWRIILL